MMYKICSIAPVSDSIFYQEDDWKAVGFRCGEPVRNPKLLFLLDTGWRRVSRFTSRRLTQFIYLVFALGVGCNPISVHSSSLTPSAKILILTSEGGSIALRTAKEGGGMYGHHGSKAAGNMIGHVLSYDLKERGISIAMIHVRPTRYEACYLRILLDSFLV